MRRIAVPAAVLAWTVVAARAQPPVTTIEITEGFGPPGTKVTMPVDLKTAEGIQIAGVEIRLTLPATLSFESAAASGLSQGVGAELTTAKDGDAVRVALAAKTDGSGTPARPIPNGTIAYLTFAIAPTAAPETDIPLEPQTTVRAVGGGQNPVPSKVMPTKVAVTAPPVPACMFYMH
jgi:hypothetical protein